MSASSYARRFLLTWLVLRFLPFPLGWLPGTEWLGSQFDAGRMALVQSASLRVFDYAIHPSFNGSGDTTYEWLALACEAALALVLGAAWPLAVARLPALAKLTPAVLPYLRLSLAGMLLTYGMVKVLPIQFGPPSWGILSQTYGDSSPMRLLWTFMGASRPYAIAGGLAELLAGALLLFAWTAGLGALVATGVMSNVVLLNFSYDVPVKIGSLTYLVTALLLLAPHAVRVGRALWAERPRVTWRDRREQLRASGRALAVAVVVCAGVAGPFTGRGDWHEQEPFAGFYDVTCSSGGASGQDWKNVEVTSHILQARAADGGGERFLLGRAEAPGAMAATRVQGDGQTAQARLAFTREADGGVVLTVNASGVERRVCLRSRPPPRFLLTSRGFHWINEFPFNF